MINIPQSPCPSNNGTHAQAGNLPQSPNLFFQPLEKSCETNKLHRPRQAKSRPLVTNQFAVKTLKKLAQ
jgi:hypothetical protein